MGMIRVFLALSVVFWHMPGRPVMLLDATTAVLLFFITSGFYMALTINQAYAPPGAAPQPGWRRSFYLSRILRLYPAYLVTVAAMVLWFGITATPNVFLNHPAMPLPAFLGLVFLNIFIAGQDFFQTIINSVDLEETNGVTRAVVTALPPHFFENIWIMVGQAWSLGSELLFYAMAPFIVRSVKRLIACICVGLAIRFGLIFGLHGFASEVWGYNFFPATCCLFCLGSLSYHLYPRLRQHRFAQRAGAAVTAGFALFALVSMLRWHAILALGPAGLDTFSLWCAYIIYALSLPLLFSCWRKNRIDRWIGELSYPLYLVHGGIIGLVFAHVHAGQGAKMALAILLSFASAAALFMLIDQPVDAWRHRHFGGRDREAEPPLAHRREWYVLAGVLALLLANTLRLDAFAPRELAAPVLVASVGNYNIVNYDDRLFGVPHNDPVTFGAPGYDQDKRLIIATQLSVVRARIAAMPKVPTLLGSAGHYNIVEYDGRVFGLLQGVPITWGAPGYDRAPGLIIATSAAQVRQRIAP
jgi:peptidoglycan/LPS O-acetylase OafA/YrhL